MQGPDHTVTWLTKMFTAVKEANFVEEENRTNHYCFISDVKLLLKEINFEFRVVKMLSWNV
jgi:hypothetical protein